MKHVIYISLLGALIMPLSAQAIAEKRAYARLGAAWSQNDLAAFLGDRAFNPIYEVGLDIPGYNEIIGLGVYCSYLAAHGDPIDKYEGLKQAIWGWRGGADIRFRTPIKGLTPFAGFNLNWWDGQRIVGGRVQNTSNFEEWFDLPKGTYPDGKVKYGMRVGVEYRINESWGVSIDGSMSAWRSRNNSSINPSPTGQRHYKGVNPVSPSWINFAVQYRWDLW